jgi:hypothetical protein
MEYEIGNHSDRCFLEADDKKVAAACILFLGNGQYFCTETATGEQIPGTFFAMGGDVEKTWDQFLGIGFEAFISKPETKLKMAECYESFRYSSARSSMNNIGKRAQGLAAEIRKALGPSTFPPHDNDGQTV